jgi:hypothetical protein
MARLIFWSVYEESEPWGLWCEGHVDPEFTEAEIRAAIAESGLDDVDVEDILELTRGRHFEHLWMSQFYERDDAKETPEDDEPWHWCEASRRGAKPVTGMSLQ